MARLTHTLSKGILSLIMLLSAYNYIFNHEYAMAAYTALGYPTYLIYPSAIIKLAGLCVLWFSKSEKLLEWVYAGFTYILVLGFFAHIMAGDGQFAFAFLGFAALLIAYVTKNKK